jgi:WD40 repeat protein
MTLSRRFLLILAIPLLVGLLAYGVRIPPIPPKPAAVEPVVEPSFTLETGLMDCWNKKTDGPDGGSKIANYGGGRIHIRDATSGRILKSLDAGGCESLAVTRDQKTLIAGTNGEFRLFDLPGGELRKEFPMQMGTYMHIVPFPNLNIAAWPTNDGFIIADLATGTEKQRIKVSEPYLTGLAVTPDGSTLLSASTDGKIRGWRINAAGMAE